MNLDRWLAGAGIAIGVLGIVTGILTAAWQERNARVKEAAAKRRGDQLVAFLHGLKGGPLSENTVVQVNDMLARLDPPKSN